MITNRYYKNTLSSLKNVPYSALFGSIVGSDVGGGDSLPPPLRTPLARLIDDFNKDFISSQPLKIRDAEIND